MKRSKDSLTADAERRIFEDCRQNVLRARRIDAFNAAVSLYGKDTRLDVIIAAAARIAVFIDGKVAS